MKLSDLFTRETANEGRQVQIPGRDGRTTSEWMRVHHTDCDSFRQKRADVLATAAMQGEDIGQDERKRRRDAAMLDLMASTVSAWSLEEECTRENVIELLKNAPYLYDWLCRITDDGSVFFGSAAPA